MKCGIPVLSWLPSARGLIAGSLGLGLLLLAAGAEADPASSGQGGGDPVIRTFAGRGVILQLDREAGQLVIRHEAITNYMAAMTMPFRVKPAEVLAGFQTGDPINFQLHVTATESWVDHIVKAGRVPPPAAYLPVRRPTHPLLDYKFTNELGQAVSLNDFRGQALAITFFYTRCPLPEYCPRLSKNFQAAQQKLLSLPQAPANWHLLSISLDPQFDSPPMLKAYGAFYQSDPDHWSFLTGPDAEIGQLARQSGVTYEVDGNTINHNFCTLIVDAAGHLQTRFPVSGDFSDAIVRELLKAAMVTNPPVAAGEGR